MDAGLVRVGASVGLALVLGLGLVACGDTESPEPLNLDEGSSTASADARASRSASASSDATEGIPTSFPDIGFEITGLPTNAAGAKHDVLATWAEFVHGHQSMTRTAQWNSMLAENGTEPGLAPMRETQQYLKERNARFAGETVMELTDFQRRGTIAVVEACIDMSGAQMVRNGTPGPIDGRPRGPIRTDLNFTQGRWLVADYTVMDGTC